VGLEIMSGVVFGIVLAGIVRIRFASRHRH
jgi:hypothetical protein